VAPVSGRSMESIFQPILSGLKPAVEYLPGLARAYRNWRDGRGLRMAPKTHPYGFLFVGNEEMASGRFEKLESDFFRRLVKDYDVFVNIGANDGYYVCIAAANGIKTLAFEPDRLNASILLRNVQINKFDGVELFPIALSDKISPVRLYGSGTGASIIEGYGSLSSNDGYLVPSNTLENVIGNRLVGKSVIVLIDVEGAEQKILDKSSFLLDARPRPTWIVEIDLNQEGSDAKERIWKTFDHFFDRGYACCTIEQRPKAFQKIMLEEVYPAPQSGWKIYNFLFTQEDKLPRLMELIHSMDDDRI
jgi:FkbM family methyltransferase